MAVVQREYGDTHSAGRPGQVATGSTFDADSHIASGAVPFGVAVRFNDDPSTSGYGRTEVSAGMAEGRFAGIAILDPTRDPTTIDSAGTPTGFQADQYRSGSHVSCAYRGDLYVRVDGAVSVGDDVSARSDDGMLSSSAYIYAAPWAATTMYNVGQVVSHRTEGSATTIAFYRCIRGHTASSSSDEQGAPSDSNATAWELIADGAGTYIKPWITGQDLSADDIVRTTSSNVHSYWRVVRDRTAAQNNAQPADGADFEEFALPLPIPGATFVKAAGAGGIAIVRLNGHIGAAA